MELKCRGIVSVLSGEYIIYVQSTQNGPKDHRITNISVRMRSSAYEFHGYRRCSVLPLINNYHFSISRKRVGIATKLKLRSRIVDPVIMRAEKRAQIIPRIRFRILVIRLTERAIDTKIGCYGNSCQHVVGVGIELHHHYDFVVL